MDKTLLQKLFRTLIMAVLAFGFGCEGMAYASNSELPEYISIGLKFSGSSAAKSTLKSEDYIYMMSYADDWEDFLFDTGKNEITVSKDGFYHIRLAEEFKHASDAANAVENTGESCAYPFFDGSKWTVVVGSFSDSQSARVGLQSMSYMGCDLEIMEKSSEYVQVAGSDGTIIAGYDSSDNVIFKSESERPVWIDGKRYRGGAVFKRISGSDMTVINRLGLEEYLYGVVPKEMSGSWPVEALKAQAVSARNYAVITMGKHSKQGFDLCATSDCQVYGGYEAECENSNKAVDKTRGKLMKYEGETVQAFYHANSGGQTEDSENVWSAALPYIRGVEDEFSAGAPNDSWSVTFTPEQIKSKLAQMNVYIGDIESMEITRESDNGRAIELEIIGTDGEKTVQKESIRKALGYNDLKSTYFKISSGSSGSVSKNISVLSANDKTSLDIQSIKMISSDRTVSSIKSDDGINIRSAAASVKFQPQESKSSQFVLEGHGFGHGLGMSQWGAKKMAESGYEYEDILKHYYTGVEIEG